MAEKNTNKKCWLPDLESYHTVEDYLYEKEPAPGIPFFGLSITVDCCEGILLNSTFGIEKKQQDAIVSTRYYKIIH